MHYRDRHQRPRAYNDPGHSHELTFSCYHKYPFLTERTCAWLAEALQAARTELQYSLWAYVFMPDHVHLIVWPQHREYNDSKFLRRVKEPVSRRAMQYLQSNSPEWLTRLRVEQGQKVEHHFWQPGRGHDRNIDSSTTLQQMIDYVHQNPVRRGLVDHPEEWNWSSAGWFAGTPRNNLPPDPIPPDWLENLG